MIKNRKNGKITKIFKKISKNLKKFKKLSKRDISKMENSRKIIKIWGFYVYFGLDSLDLRFLQNLIYMSYLGSNHHQEKLIKFYYKKS